MSELLIARRYCGPPRSGNGGYVAGALAELGAHLLPAGAACEVTLRRPPPLDVPMQVATEAGTTSLRHGGEIVATAEAVAAEPDPIEPVSYDEAVAASSGYPGHTFHPFPTCFSCGVERTDGLRIFPGPVTPALSGAVRVAAPWTPDPSVDLPTVWAALDCIGGWSGDLGERLMVLGRITATVDTVPVAGEPHVVMGQALGTEGRRTMTRSTIYDSDGRIVGRAAHVWVAVDPVAFNQKGTK